MRLSARVIVALLLASLSLGCGDGLVDVHGAVKLDGQPVGEGAMQFFPVDGKGASAGANIASGTYTARLPAGKFKVEITAPKVVGKRKMYDTPDSPTVDVTTEAIPAQYNTESTLTVDVTPASKQHNFDLKSK